MKSYPASPYCSAESNTGRYRRWYLPSWRWSSVSAGALYLGWTWTAERNCLPPRATHGSGTERCRRLTAELSRRWSGQWGHLPAHSHLSSHLPRCDINHCKFPQTYLQLTLPWFPATWTVRSLSALRTTAKMLLTATKVMVCLPAAPRFHVFGTVNNRW